MRLGYVGFGLALALSYLLGVEAVDATARSTATSDKLPTEDTNTVDDDNNTALVLQITDYHYIDWLNIGYQIFLDKMYNAIKTLQFFRNLDPMVLKITRTYTLSNDTDLDLTNNSTYGKSNGTASEDNFVETNTESPLYTIYLSPEESNGGKINSSKESQSKADDVVKTKTEGKGFFSSIASAAASVYHTLTDWL